MRLHFQFNSKRHFTAWVFPFCKTMEEFYCIPMHFTSFILTPSFFPHNPVPTPYLLLTICLFYIQFGPFQSHIILKLVFFGLVTLARSSCYHPTPSNTGTSCTAHTAPYRLVVDICVATAHNAQLWSIDENKIIFFKII